MKFGEQLRSSVIREYQWYYIDYDGLKAELKNASGPLVTAGEEDENRSSKHPRHEWTEDDEGRFVSKLEAELDKVHTKQQVKAMEISRRIAVSEREVRDVVNSLQERGLGQDGPSEEEFMLLEEDLSDIIADVHDLAKFVQLNYTGFFKIIKKHDVSVALSSFPAGIPEGQHTMAIAHPFRPLLTVPLTRNSPAGISSPCSTPVSRRSRSTRRTTMPLS